MGGRVSYFAAAVAREASGWTAAELDLTGVTGLDDVAERLGDLEPDAQTSLLFVEADDAYLVIMRLDENGDLRVFGSDSAYAEESRLGEVLVGELKPAPTELDDEESPAPRRSGDGDDEDETPAADPDADPVGDSDLLADLGVSAARLLELCAHDGLLPSDVTAELCQLIGCGDEVEELRGV